MQINLFYKDLRSFVPNPNACEFPEPRTTTYHHPPPTSKPWRPPPYTTISPPKNHTVTTIDASSTGRRVGVVIVPQSLAQPQRGAATSERTRWLGPMIHLRPEGQGPWGPTKTTKTTQQSIWMRAGVRGGGEGLKQHNNQPSGMDNSTKNKQ